MEFHFGDLRAFAEPAPIGTVEHPVAIYTRVFSELKPRTPIPAISIEFCAWANANSTIRLHEGRLEVRITDALEGAPSDIHEALARILFSKLYRKPVPAADNQLYR